MGTRSAIGYFENNNILVTYCHYDGYFEGVGLMLFKHYNEDDLAAQLTDLGDIFSLCETIEETEGTWSEQSKTAWSHTTKTFEPVVHIPLMFTTPNDVVEEAKERFWDYIYLWDKNYLQWFTITAPYSRWRSLQDVVDEISQ